VSARSVLGARANLLLRPLNVQLIAGMSPDPAVKNFLPARKTIAAARAAGLSVSAYIDKIHVEPGATGLVVKEMLSIAGLSGKCEAVCEVGAGSGRFAEEVIAALHPDTYEIYETARDWLPYLRKLPNAVVRDSDGHTLASTRDAAVDLVHAQKVFVYLPFYASAGYIAEMARVVRPGGTVVLDVVTEDCLDETTVSTWIQSASIFHPIPREWLLGFLADRDLTLAGSFFTPLPPGKAEVFVFHKKAGLAGEWWLRCRCLARANGVPRRPLPVIRLAKVFCRLSPRILGGCQRIRPARAGLS
jgi:SAM-dependent methyltransferase